MNPFGNIDEGWRGWRFWLKNPCHNLFNYMWRRMVTRPIYILTISDPEPEQRYLLYWSNGAFRNENRRTFVLRVRPFFLKIGLFFIGWRSDKPIAAWGGGVTGGAFDVGIKRLG